MVMVTHNTAIRPIAHRVVHLRNGAIDGIEKNEQPKDISDLDW